MNSIAIILGFLATWVLAQQQHQQQQHHHQQQQQQQQQQRQLQSGVQESSQLPPQLPLQPQLPPFLEGASASVVSSFEKLLSEGYQRTDLEMEQAVEDWVLQQDVKIQKAFKEFKEKLMEAAKIAEQRHKEAVAKLSPAAQKADAQLVAVASSPVLTAAQKDAQIQKILSSLPPGVKQELQKAVQG